MIKQWNRLLKGVNRSAFFKVPKNQLGTLLRNLLQMTLFRAGGGQTRQSLEVPFMTSTMASTVNFLSTLRSEKGPVKWIGLWYFTFYDLDLKKWKNLHKGS